MMLYHGLVVDGPSHQRVYKFLQAALRAADLKKPYRGPALFKKKGWNYTCKIQGNVEKFEGREVIEKDKAGVYEASFVGGLVGK